MLFGRGPLGQVSDDGQRIGFFVGGFDDHEDPEAQDDAFHEVVDSGVGVDGGEDGVDGPLHEQPEGEEIESLEGVEADRDVIAESLGGEDDDAGDPADGGDVAEDRSGSWRDSGHGVGGSINGLIRLPGPALGAEGVPHVDLVAAMAAEWHLC